MYHYVRIEDEGYPSFQFLHLEDFKKQLDFFANNYTILHPSDLAGSIYSGNFKDGIILTFDDGLKDHYQFVLPELLKRGLSAIFYISTGMYETRKILGVHRIHLLLGRFGSELIYHKLNNLVTDNMISHGHVQEFHTIPYSLQRNDEYTAMVKKMMNYFISYEYREHILNVLMDDLFGGDDEIFDSFYLSENEIKTMHNAGMVIGSHTKTHPVLSKLSNEEQEIEIQTSFDFLENICTKLPYKTFCYPYGGFHSFTTATKDLLTKAGCLFSFNVESRDISESDLKHGQQVLPRYDCNYFPHGQLWRNKKFLNAQA